jgi:ribose transport system permease protein
MSVTTNRIAQLTVKERIRELSTTAFWMTLVLLGLIAVFALVTPNHAFWQISNFQAMGRDAAIGLLLAVAMTYILGSGHLDLSIGANLVLSSVFCAKLMAGLISNTSMAMTILIGFFAVIL